MTSQDSDFAGGISNKKALLVMARFVASRCGEEKVFFVQPISEYHLVDVEYRVMSCRLLQLLQKIVTNSAILKLVCIVPKET